MAIDQNLIPKDLRPLNLNRTVVDEPARVPATVVRDVSSPRSRPVFFPTAAAVAADPNFVGLGFGNPPVSNPRGLGFGNPMAVWCSRPPEAIPIGAPVPVPASAAAPCSEVPNFGNRIGGNSSDFGVDESSDDPSVSKKVKFLCSFGGKILPRPSDGMLRYVGGQTRIIAVKRDINFQELMQKLTDSCGQPVVIKYQLPEEDLDALVSVSCGEDLENMMEEYQKLVETSPEGSAKIRVFLFSANEVDQSTGILQSSDVSDSAQRYVDAINGITEGMVGIRRKESMASLSSTQNSDGPVSGGEVVDNSGVGQGDSDGTSPVLPGSRDSTRLLYFAPPNTVNHPTVVSGPPQNLSSSARPDHELERTLPPNGQPPMAYDLQPTTVGFPPGTVYVQTYVDPRQEGFNHVDYSHNSSQIAYSNNHPMGIGGSVYRRSDHPHHPPQQLRDSLVGLPLQHSFVPALQVANASSPQVIMRPYLEESSYGARVVQVPSDQNYKTYQAHPVPMPTTLTQGQVFEHYGWAPQQHGILPEKMLRLDDCYMCQKGLPHVHSDTLIQEHGNTIKSSVSETNPVFISDENPISRPPYKVVSGTLVDGMVEHQMGPFSFTQIPDENERIRLQKAENHDHVRMLTPPNVMGLPGEVPSYGMFIHQDGLQQQPLVPSLYQIKQDVSMNKSVVNDTPPVRNVPFQASEPHIRESAVEYAGKQPGYSPKEEVSDLYFSCDHLRPINGRIEGMYIGPSAISGINDQSVSPFKHNFNVPKESNPESVPLVIKNGLQIAEPFSLSDANIAREEIHDNRSQIAGTEMYLVNPFIKPGIVPIDPLPSSSSEVTSLHSIRPIESSHASLILGDPGPCPHLKVGVEPVMSDELWHGKPMFSCMDTTYNDNIPVGDWKDEASRFQSRMVLHNQPSTPVSSDAPFYLSSSSSASRPLGDNSDPKFSNTLFSNQDPWNLRQHTHLLPPKGGKVPVKEVFFSRDSCNDNHLGNSVESSSTTHLDERGFHQPSVSLSKDSCPEPIQSVGGSAEERIKQELKAVAEGVAASVLQSSIPPPVSILSIGEMNEIIAEANRDIEVHDSDVESQVVEAPVDVKIQDIETKLSDKLNPGFPIKDSIGRLQIIPNSDLEELRELGSGTFGTVYHGKWRGSDVAIKRINDRCFAGKPSEQDRMREDFWNEAVKLADLHHPNVVAFYGVVLDGPGGSVATVTEYMVNGSLRHALMRNDRVLDRRKRLLIALDVAFGMEYLHSKNIVHFDLKSDNLLVNLRDPQRPICKVGDLGLSKVKCQTLISGGVRGTLPWMAPELLNGSSSLVSEKVDVFSFGIVLWELVTGEEPYANLHYGAIIGGIVSNTLRPPVPESCNPEWRLLMERCWSADPSERPSFTEIAGSLRSMAASLPPKGQQQSPVQSQAQK